MEDTLQRSSGLLGRKGAKSMLRRIADCASPQKRRTFLALARAKVSKAMMRNRRCSMVHFKGLNEKTSRPGRGKNGYQLSHLINDGDARFDEEHEEYEEYEVRNKRWKSRIKEKKERYEKVLERNNVFWTTINRFLQALPKDITSQDRLKLYAHPVAFLKRHATPLVYAELAEMGAISTILAVSSLLDKS